MLTQHLKCSHGASVTHSAVFVEGGHIPKVSGFEWCNLFKFNLLKILIVVVFFFIIIRLNTSADTSVCAILFPFDQLLNLGCVIISDSAQSLLSECNIKQVLFGPVLGSSVWHFGSELFVDGYRCCIWTPDWSLSQHYYWMSLHSSYNVNLLEGS